MTALAGALPAGRRGRVNPGLAWPLGLSVLAWAALVGLSAGPEGLALCLGGGTGVPARIGAEFAALWAFADPVALGLEWALMVAAMMLPLAAVSLSRAVAQTAPHARRAVLAGGLAGYLGVWLALGPVVILGVLWARAALGVVPGAPLQAVLPFLPALLWAGLAARRRVLARAHRVPLFRGPVAAQGRQALGWGGLLGARCAALCLPLMAAPMVSGQTLPVMLATLHVLLGERLAHEPGPRDALRAAALLAVLAALAAG